jgi:hypothetical protein
MFSYYISERFCLKVLVYNTLQLKNILSLNKNVQ